MLNIEEIKTTINELENQQTTFDTCQKLANLYTVLEHYEKQALQSSADSQPDMPNETMFPNYPIYCDRKAKYQMRELGSIPVLDSLSALCFDIQKFIITLYSATDMEDERSMITNILLDTLETIGNKYIIK